MGGGQIGIGTHVFYHESPRKPTLTNVCGGLLGNNNPSPGRLDG